MITALRRRPADWSAGPHPGQPRGSRGAAEITEVHLCGPSSPSSVPLRPPHTRGCPAYFGAGSRRRSCLGRVLRVRLGLPRFVVKPGCTALAPHRHWPRSGSINTFEPRRLSAPPQVASISISRRWSMPRQSPEGSVTGAEHRADRGKFTVKPDWAMREQRSSLENRGTLRPWRVSNAVAPCVA